MEANELNILKSDARAIIEGMRGDLVRLGTDIFDHPELAYQEHRTAAIVAEQLRRLGLSVADGLAVTGVKSRIDMGSPGPQIAVLCELDGLSLPSHPAADPGNGAAHACGHNAQVVHLVAVANVLNELRISRHLAGKIAFLACPAEEFTGIDRGIEMRAKGEVQFLGGKQELIRLGHFDDIDLAILVHARGSSSTPLAVGWSYNGMIPKRVRFRGRASHAGAAPEKGVNALNAATLAIAAVHAQRETFGDDDHVRVHPVLRGSESGVNVVPDDVRIDAYVRAASIDAMLHAETTFDRAMRAGALALGAKAEILTLPGYLPLTADPTLGRLFRENSVRLVGENGYTDTPHIAASTDMGDLSHILPVLQANHGGCAGSNHGSDFQIQDPNEAYILPAIALAWTVIDLMADGASVASRVVDSYRPLMTIEQYLKHLDSLDRKEEYPPE